ncbi:methylglyoxal synthase [Clostridium saccharoperbutylacetonicum]|jgi:methylglyoxal synthase|uniref:Methylglyoxal synthase n=1 Tax=Clostridium saccharoperbutylacetonicum N1-4(HMT) TaxID=931276 RepID=M1LM39_9CLOT|nr:methylglyoxal synthase [Clostridium saccharoperbutylacetonicum]AGF53875.1 methylglyoxal synthase MgsA [Clostridium saccharoperbutylacetonicum N1-4(HMT)]NRT59612.1 methylglyoxal synthase [Clostridium saccharoperbutylacetonicum]NSB28804.1 methylglyoxal synthase [Clostridium saccharoperbutylacetonicum]NSB42295.1 methylglyoxal synthase [Clostridium saccharoperbutylacetonicum]
MKIALIAHDKKKEDIIEFAKKYKDTLAKYDLVATGTTGKKISEATGLEVKRYLSGPYGGDQQLGGRIAEGKIDLVIFFTDPLTAQPHEPDVNALLRVCNVHNVAVVTNVKTAELVIKEF